MSGDHLLEPGFFFTITSGPQLSHKCFTLNRNPLMWPVYRHIQGGTALVEDIMAERMVRQLIDDLDGTEIADGKGEQIEFSVRGVTYRIDLGPGNLNKFEKALAPFIESATKVSGRGRSRSSGRGRSSGRASKEELSAIRAWAAKQGHKVSARGRIPGDVVRAYEAAKRR